MRRRFGQRLVLALSCLIAVGAGSADPQPAAGSKRIVSLAPHLTELAYAAGIGDLLVGAVEWSDYPRPARALPRIGDAFRFDLERIVRLEATHALAWPGGTPAQAIQRLENLGLEVERVPTRTLAQIGKAIEQLGALGANPDAAAARAAQYRRRLEGMRRAADTGAPPIPVFYQVSEQPLFTLGGEHVLGDVLGLCNAANVFADLETEAASVGLEAVLARDPLAIVASDDGSGDPVAHWRDHPGLRAVDCDNLLRVDPALLVRPTPRVLDGAEKLCQWLDEEVRPAENPACRIDRD